jgi:cellulose synthase operon protein YhjQ
MTDRKALLDPNDTPEDVASLYSWANLHGAKYRDFSASRAQSREKARLHAIELERERIRQEMEAQRAEEARRAAEEARAQEEARRSEMAAQQQAAQFAAQQAAQHAAQQAAQQAAQEMARQAAQQAALEARMAQAQAAQYAQSAQQAAHDAWQQPARFAPQPAFAPPQPQAPAYAAPQPFRPAAAPSQLPPMREESFAPPVAPAWAAPEAAARPAWLAERLEPVTPPAPAPAPGDTIQGSRDRLTSRWFALKGIFDHVPAANPPAETALAPVASRVPVVGVFSLAGGVGKTSLVATLGRALSARGERVMLVDTSAFGLLPFFFGARDQRPGQLRTFSPPTASGDAPIQMLAVDPDTLGPENAPQEALSSEIAKHTRGVSRVIVDLATASGSTTRRILKLSPVVLVPVVPDMNSVVSVSAIDAFFERHAGAAGKSALPYYVLNQFDPSLPLHLDVREVLREQLGDRLLPFALRRTPAVSEALAEGMTVMDYAPNSTVAEDFGSLAGWLKSLSAPASGTFRGVRWSER